MQSYASSDEMMVSPRYQVDRTRDASTSTYFGEDHLAWARRWPLEHIWKVSKQG